MKKKEEDWKGVFKKKNRDEIHLTLDLYKSFSMKQCLGCHSIVDRHAIQIREKCKWPWRWCLLIFPSQQTLFILDVLPSLISHCLWMFSFRIDSVSHFVHSMCALYSTFDLVSHQEYTLQASTSIIVFLSALHLFLLLLLLKPFLSLFVSYIHPTDFYSIQQKQLFTSIFSNPCKS